MNANEQQDFSSKHISIDTVQTKLFLWPDLILVY